MYIERGWISLYTDIADAEKQEQILQTLNTVEINSMSRAVSSYPRFDHTPPSHPPKLLLQSC